LHWDEAGPGHCLYYVATEGGVLTIQVVWWEWRG
jgi:hypothetical protein